jgi:hypothetical protein
MKIFIQMIKNDNNLPMNHGIKLKNDKNSLIEAKDSLINHENSCINNENAMRNGANSFINGENLLLNGVNAGSNVQNPCSHTVRKNISVCFDIDYSRVRKVPLFSINLCISMYLISFNNKLCLSV